MPAPANQTISYLSQRFSDVGLRLNARHGQNFLIDLNLLRLLVERAELTSDDVALEIGTGTGALTGLLAERAAAVVTVEIDSRLYQLASEELFGFDNVVMLPMDALASKSRFDPRVIENVKQKLAEAPGRRLKLTANLPYSVATPVIANLLASEIVPDTMTVTIQKELAERIVAAPGTKDYGALSVWIQSQCSVELVRILSPTVFWPRPKVHSAIVHITVDPARRAAIEDLEFFHDFTRSLFFHRRKFLRAVLQSSLKGRLGKPEVDGILERANLNPQIRSEQLDVPSILRLSEVARAALGGQPLAAAAEGQSKDGAE